MAITLNLASQLASAEFWYVHSEGATFGPFTPMQMDELGKQQRLGPQTMVVPAGENNWLALENYLPSQESLRVPTSAELEEIVGIAPFAAVSEATAEVPPLEEPTKTASRFGSLKRSLRRG